MSLSLIVFSQRTRADDARRRIVFSLDIPANNCAILQSGNDLELLTAGQHCITHPNVTLRGLYTLGENQFEMPTKDMCVDCLCS